MNFISIRVPALSACCLALMLGSTSLAQSTQRVSVSSGGVQANGAAFGFLSTSSDGRYVAFCSTASNLVPGDTNGYIDVFVRDPLSGTTERVSVGSGGTQGSNGDSVEPSISADGRYVAFTSSAIDLVPGDVNAADDAFVHDRLTGTTEIVSIDSTGMRGNDYTEYASISADGRYVAFISFASNLVTGDTNSDYDTFVHDRSTGTTERVSVDSSGAQAIGASVLAATSMSADGRYVAFCSSASNLVAGDTNGHNDAFVHDRLTGVTERVSVDSNGVQGNANSGDWGVILSGDGRFVAFMSYATNLVAGDTNGSIDVFVRDRQNGTTERVSVGVGGVQANSYSGINGVSISFDGRYVTFDSHASNLIVGATSASDVYVRDRLSGTTERISVDPSGNAGNGASYVASISADGRFVAFQSVASNLVFGDTNGVGDDFLRDRGAAIGAGFCFGDGSGTACPCGNNSPVGANSGCLNSFGSGGTLVATGHPSISADTLVLNGSGMSNSSVLYFQGTTQSSAGAGTVFGDGLRCAGGAVLRLSTKTNVGGASQYPVAGDLSISVKGADVAGDVRTYQAWYRNSAAFCSASVFNLTNGWSLTWAP